MDWIKSLAASVGGLHRTTRLARGDAEPEVLAHLGRVAAEAAAARCGLAVVMTAVREAVLVAPAPVGALMHVHARVVREHGDGLTVVACASLDAAPGTARAEIASAGFEFAAVDRRGRRCLVSPRADAVALAAGAPNSSAELSKIDPWRT